jgi:hypothetical protein
MLRKHAFHAFGGKHAGKGESRLRQERRYNFLKPAFPRLVSVKESPSAGRFQSPLCSAEPALVEGGEGFVLARL